MKGENESLLKAFPMI